MNILYIIDFDIVIVTVILFNLLSGIRGGIKTQIKKIVSTALPVVVMIFALSPVDQLISQWAGFESLFTSVCTMLGMKPFMNTIRSLIVAWVIYLVSWSIVQLLFRIFSSKKAIKRALEITKWWSRLGGAFLSIINSYLLLTLFLLILGTITSISYVTPLTKAFNSIQIPGYSISQLSLYENILPGYYNEMATTYNKISGQDLEEYYDSYVQFQNNYDVINRALDDFSQSLTLSEQKVVEKAAQSAKILYHDNIHIYLSAKNNSVLIADLTVWPEYEPLVNYLLSTEVYVRIIDIMGNRDYQNIEDFYSNIINIYDELLLSVNYLDSQTIINNMSSDYTFYLNHHNVLDNYLDSPENLEDYISCMKKVFSNESSLASFSYNFLKDYDELNAHDELYELYSYLKTFEKYRSYFSLLGEDLTIPEKMVLLPYAKSFYHDESWQSSSMLSSYLNDAWANTVTPGHRLYTDYLLTCLSIDTLSPAENMSHIISELASLKSDNLITEDAYETLLENICLEEDGIFRQKLRQGAYTQSELDNIYNVMKNYYNWENLACLKAIITYKI